MWLAFGHGMKEKSVEKRSTERGKLTQKCGKMKKWNFKRAKERKTEKCVWPQK